MPCLDNAARHDPQLQRILNSALWKRVREMAALRAGYRCEECHAFLGMNGEGHHVIPRRDCEAAGISVFDPANVEWLCDRCHSKKTAQETHRPGTMPKGWRHARTKVRGRQDYLGAVGLGSPSPEAGGGPVPP